jgi:hypothetical protein
MKQDIVKKIKESLEEITQSLPAQATVKSKPKETVVVFDKSTNPFEVKFSERGFEINDTRFSFEFIETALSKEVNIVLEKGNGIVLDSIKMNKILHIT